MTNTRYAAVVIGDFYQDIARGLLASCEQTLAEGGVQSEVFTVPGALEIPFALQQLANRDYYCYVALGCVIRGETYHFEVVANTSAAGIMQIQLELDIPVGNGILTVESKAQAMARLDKGGEAARAALALAQLG